MNEFISQILFYKKPNKRFLKKLVAYYSFIFDNEMYKTNKYIKNYLKYKTEDIFCPYIEENKLISALYTIHNDFMIDTILFQYEIYDYLLDYIFQYQNLEIQHSNHLININDIYIQIEYQLTNDIFMNDTPNRYKELPFEIKGEEDSFLINYITGTKEKYKKLLKNVEYKNEFSKQFIFIYIIQWICGFSSNDFIITNTQKQLLPLNETLLDITNSQPFDFKKLFSNKNNFFNKEICECIIGYFNYTPNLEIYKQFLQQITEIYSQKSNTKYNNIIYRINKMYRYFD